MKESWERAISSVLVWEGGFASRIQEPGGAVNRGISLTTYREDHPNATVDDLKAMTEEEAKEIYARRYAKPIGFDELPSPLDLVMLHAAVMFGVTGAKHFLAASTARAARHGMTPLELCGDVVIRMMENKMNRRDGMNFMPGWAKRFQAIYDIAKDISGEMNAVQPDVVA